MGAVVEAVGDVAMFESGRSNVVMGHHVSWRLEETE